MAKIGFFSETYSATLEIDPYQYKMIKGIDLYTFVKNESTKHSNIEWRYEKVNNIRTVNEKAIVELETETLTADYIFNSILFSGLPVSPLGGGGGDYFYSNILKDG
jgi:lycopene beta-cyclase